MSVSEEKKKAFQENVHEHYLDKLVQNLDDRFCDSGVIRALATIFSPEKAVRVDSANFTSYGEHELDVLSSQYAGTVEKEHLCQEWACFKHMLVNDFKELSVKKLMIVMAGDVSFSMLYPTIPYSSKFS